MIENETSSIVDRDGSSFSSDSDVSDDEED